MEKFLLCCDNGKWYEVEASNAYEAIKQTRTFSNTETVIFIFSMDDEFSNDL